jgi:hypothetical protein
MTMTLRPITGSILAIALVAATIMPAGIAAAPQTTSRPEPPTPVPVHLKIVVDKTEGDKPTVSIPFEVVVRANTGAVTTLNHGRSVPVAQTTFLPMASGGVATMPQVSSVYQSVGSNLSITDVKLVDKVLTFQMMIDVSFQDSAAGMGGNPTFRKFSIQLMVTSKLGETAVVAVSNDRTTNETAKVSVLADLVR